MFKDFRKFNKGFILMLTLIVMSVVLMVGLGIYSIITREISVSRLGRDSQLSLYAADSGIECALYWDISKKSVSTTTPSTIRCSNQNINLPGAPVSNFVINFDNGACVRVIIDKSSYPNTQISAYGYNVDCSPTAPGKVERGVRVSY